MGGTLAGVLATGLASSSVICGALFGAYGAHRTSEIIERYTREVGDLGILPVHPPKDTLAVRLCISGWLNNVGDITAPWIVFDETEDTFALRWVSLGWKILAGLNIFAGGRSFTESFQCSNCSIESTGYEVCEGRDNQADIPRRFNGSFIASGLVTGREDHRQSLDECQTASHQGW